MACRLMTTWQWNFHLTSCCANETKNREASFSFWVTIKQESEVDWFKVVVKMSDAGRWEVMVLSTAGYLKGNKNLQENLFKNIPLMCNYIWHCFEWKMGPIAEGTYWLKQRRCSTLGHMDIFPFQNPLCPALSRRRIPKKENWKQRCMSLYL